MNFKDLKRGYAVYILDKSKMAISTVKVKDVSLPHVDPKFVSTSMVVDVTLETEGDDSPSVVTYCMPCDADVAYPQNKVISIDRANLLREVESMKAMSEQALAQVERHRDIIQRATNLIAELDPSQREKQDMENRLTAIENSIQNMMSLLTKSSEQL